MSAPPPPLKPYSFGSIPEFTFAAVAREETSTPIFHGDFSTLRPQVGRGKLKWVSGEVYLDLERDLDGVRDARNAAEARAVLAERLLQEEKLAREQQRKELEELREQLREQKVSTKFFRANAKKKQVCIDDAVSHCLDNHVCVSTADAGVHVGTQTDIHTSATSPICVAPCAPPGSAPVSVSVACGPDISFLAPIVPQTVSIGVQTDALPLSPPPPPPPPPPKYSTTVAVMTDPLPLSIKPPIVSIAVQTDEPPPPPPKYSTSVAIMTDPLPLSVKPPMVSIAVQTDELPPLLRQRKAATTTGTQTLPPLPTPPANAAVQLERTTSRNASMQTIVIAKEPSSLRPVALVLLFLLLGWAVVGLVGGPEGGKGAFGFGGVEGDWVVSRGHARVSGWLVEWSGDAGEMFV